MQQPFLNMKSFAHIKQNMQDLVAAIPQHCGLGQLPVKQNQQYTNTRFPDGNSYSGVLKDFNKNDEMILQDLFGAINY